MAGKEVQYIEYIKGKSPQLQIKSVGYDFTDDPYGDLVVINGETIYKFSKYDWTAAFLENEVKAIQFAGRYLSMPLPDIERLDKGIVRYSRFRGGPLIRSKLLLLSSRDQERLAETVAEFLRQLHSIPLKAAKSAELGECEVCRTAEDWLSEYEEIRQKVYPLCERHIRDSIQQLFQPLVEDENFLDFQPTLIHADLNPQNFYYDEKSTEIVGVGGFGRSGAGDPAYDLSVLINHLGEAFLKRVARYYRTVDTLVDRARFYAHAERLLWSKNVADMIATHDFTHFKIHLGETDLMPVGSRW